MGEVIPFRRSHPVTRDEARAARIKYLRHVADDLSQPFPVRVKAAVELGTLGEQWRSKLLAERGI